MANIFSFIISNPGGGKSNTMTHIMNFALKKLKEHFEGHSVVMETYTAAGLQVSYNFSLFFLIYFFTS